MKTDMVPLHYLKKRSHLNKDNIHTKTWFPIILIIISNMSCINVLTSTHNLSVDRNVRPEKFQFMEKGQNHNFDYKIVISVKNP